MGAVLIICHAACGRRPFPGLVSAPLADAALRTRRDRLEDGQADGSRVTSYDCAVPPLIQELGR